MSLKTLENASIPTYLTGYGVVAFGGGSVGTGVPTGYAVGGTGVGSAVPGVPLADDDGDGVGDCPTVGVDTPGDAWGAGVPVGFGPLRTGNGDAEGDGVCTLLVGEAAAGDDVD